MRQSQGGDYVADPKVQDYVRQVGNKLAAVSDRKLPYEFSVVNDSSANAWALPGGKIAIHRGLLTELKSEAELAAVLSHEIVHAETTNTADLDFGEDSDVSYLDLDWIITGDSNQIELDLDSAYATNYMDIFGDSNDLTFTGSGYGASANDAAYFYLDLEGDSNTMVIKQQSTLAADWLKIESNTSNSNICVIQNDGGTSTSC